MTVFVDKRVLTAFHVEEQTQCQCGGYSNIVHCPQCGSTQCYANKRASPEALLPGISTPTRVRAFRCKLCSNLFSEVDCVNACHAQTRWKQKTEQEHRVSKTIDQAPPEVVSDILEAGRRHLARVRGETGKPVVDEQTAKLFEEPKLDNGSE